MRSYGLELREDGGHVMRRALYSEFEGQSKKLRRKRPWRKQVKKESLEAGLSRKDAFCRTKWIVGINQIATGQM